MTCQRLDRFVVQAQIQNSIHHTRHRNARTRPHRNQQWVIHICEFFTHNRFNMCNTCMHLIHQIRRICFVVVIVICTNVCCDCKPRWHRQTNQIHFGQICAFAPQQITHICAAFGGTIAERIYPFIAHGFSFN